MPVTTHESNLGFYSQASPFTSAGRYTDLLSQLPRPIDELVEAIQHLIVYDVVAPEFYGFPVPEARQHEIHLRRTEQMIERLMALDDRPLSLPRPVDKRLVGRCGQYTRFLATVLRARNIPARGRGGFGAYFNPPFFEDHWVCEYWHAAKKRWILVDPQFDEVWRSRLKIDHDILDVPRNRFLVASDAWTRCRAGTGDPSRFGIDFVGLRGLWFIAGSLIRDLAALNGMEMLPWDMWGAQPRAEETLDADRLAFFDRLAELTRDPDSSFDAMRQIYERDDRVRVPVRVFNSLLNRLEPLE